MAHVITLSVMVENPTDWDKIYQMFTAMGIVLGKEYPRQVSVSSVLVDDEMELGDRDA